MAGANAAPLSPRQLAALAGAVWRELTWSLPHTRREIARWKKRAEAIPSAAIRQDALRTIATKRGHIDGAALFTILPSSRSACLLRLLVAYELIWDFLDTVNEHGVLVGAGQQNGRQLHLALIDALDSSRPIADYYRHHPWRADGGFLRLLVETCRESTQGLPSYDVALPSLLVEAHRAQVLAINHDPDSQRRDSDLRAWAQANAPATDGTTWYELSGAASASLTIHALLALAAMPDCTAEQIKAARAAYFPWISAATTMLDSYVDQHDDLLHGDHSYIAHYPDKPTAIRKIGALLEESLQLAHDLPKGRQHAIIVASMIAMYLSKDSARGADLRHTSAVLAEAGGSLTKLLRPILRGWRLLHAQKGN